MGHPNVRVTNAVSNEWQEIGTFAIPSDGSAVKIAEADPKRTFLHVAAISDTDDEVRIVFSGSATGGASLFLESKSGNVSNAGVPSGPFGMYTFNAPRHASLPFSGEVWARDDNSIGGQLIVTAWRRID